MECLAEQLIARAARGAATQAELDAVDKHIDRCPTCREILTCATRDATQPAARSLTRPPAAQLDSYIVGGEIARGGMGRVLAGYDRRLVRPVAIKQGLENDAEHAARLEREARITARLQHPGIVPVYEAGRTDADQPFFAMRLLPGDSLRGAVESCKHLAERVALFPRVVSATNAVAFAHGEGVIHRDLKPDNVLLGEYGETLVIDWGLAKELVASGPTNSPFAAAGPLEADPLQTADGRVMGTPVYMPPEQARGEPLDERADVYALGAILYYVLAGQPPYTGNDVQEVVAKVLAGPPPSLDEVAPGAPRDLKAIVARAMVRDPEDRYPSAKELALDMQRFQAGQLVAAREYGRGALFRRWLRRRRAAATVVAAALATVVAITAVSVQRIVEERDSAQAARARAATQRDAAEELIRFSLRDLTPALRSAGRLELVDTFVAGLLAYYEQLEPMTSSDPEELARHAGVVSEIARVNSRRGQLEDAARNYQRALSLLERGRELDPGRRVMLAREGYLRARLARVHMDRDDREAGRDQLLAAELLFRGLIDTAPDARDSARWKFYQAGVKHSLGIYYYDSGELGTAERSFASSLQLGHESAAGGFPDGARNAAAAVSSIGLVQLVSGRLDSAIDTSDRDIALALEQRSGDDAYSRFAVADARLVRGEIETGAGRLELARQSLENGVATLTELLRGDPENIEWAHSLARGHWMIARLLLRQGAVDAAREEFSRAEEVFKKTRDAAADRASDEGFLIEREHGCLLAAEGDRPGAGAALARALSKGRQLVDRTPDDALRRVRYATAYRYLGELERASGRVERALAALSACAEEMDRVRKEAPAVVEAALVRAQCARARGDVWLASGDPAAARREYETGLAMAEALPGRCYGGWGAALTGAERGLGDVAFADGQPSAALVHYERARQVNCGGDGTDLDTRVLRAEVHARLARLTRGRAAAVHARVARKIVRRLPTEVTFEHSERVAALRSAGALRSRSKR